MNSLPVSMPKPKVELRFKCSRLKNLDLLSKSDPQIYIYHKKGSGALELLGKTEKINNNLNPTFKKTIICDYYFESIQTLTFIVMDIDGEISNLDSDDKIGEYTTTLGNIISKPGKRIVGDLKHKGKETGTIEITAEEIQETGHNIILKVEGSKLDKKDLFGKSDPYFKLYKASPNGNLLVYQSPVIKSNLNPSYDPFILKLEELNGGDMFREIVFEFFDYDSIGEHDFIGMFRTTTDQILRGGSAVEFPLINPKKVSTKKDYKNSGIITFSDARLVGKPTFIDYLSGGCEINLIVAIDCTASNGGALIPGSLHYNTPTHQSEYAKSIMSVGSVLAPYDTDGNIDVVGFGGIHYGSTSHCFNFGKGEARGVEGVLCLYTDVIKDISLSYPTNFEEVINHASKKSQKDISSKHQKYTILLILTDGEISDMNETKKAIIKASSKSPLSIVIIGVGSSSFTNMNELDGDDGPLKDNSGNISTRDIVQFVPFSQYANNPELLACETLKEIPQQLVSYMESNNILPSLRK